MVIKTLYTKFIAPRSAQTEMRSREVTLNILLVGTLLLAGSAVLIVTSNLFILHADYAVSRWIFSTGVAGFFLWLYLLSRRGHYKLASYLFVLTYFAIVAGLVGAWGIQIPQGILLAGFAIIISGILLGPRFALVAAVVDIAILTVAQLATHPDTSWKNTPAASGDIVVFGATFALIALVCWLYDSQIEKSLRRAERSERALRRQKDLLEIKVEERTKKLQEAQMEQMQQIYRFAELGLISTALLHDLANHLSAVSVDIEGLAEERSSHILSRVKRTIRYIDDSVQKTRQQLQGQDSARQFSVVPLIHEVTALLSYKAHEARVRLDVKAQNDEAPKLKGERMRFKQLFTNLIANAIESYATVTSENQRVVHIHIAVDGDRLRLTVRDHGAGMSDEQRANLFSPFYTTKKKGMGLGMFIGKEIVEKSFGGRIRVVSHVGEGTTFSIEIPLEKA